MSSNDIATSASLLAALSSAFCLTPISRRHSLPASAVASAPEAKCEQSFSSCSVVAVGAPPASVASTGARS